MSNRKDKRMTTAAPITATDTRRFRSRVEVVTPELAEQWLERNTNNRKLNEPVKDRNVAAYGRDMKAGKWHLTGDAIKFDTNGELLDGQHRLWACVVSGASFETMVVHNVEPDARIVIDTGKKRTFAHYLQMVGEPRSSNLAAIVGLCCRWDAGNIAGDGTMKGQRLVVSHEDALTFLEQNPDVRDSVGFGERFYRDVKHGLTPAGAAHYLNGRVDSAASDEFWDRAATGENLSAGSPILAMRRWAVNVAAARARTGGVGVSAELSLVYFLKAMQIWRDGKSIRVLQVKPGDKVKTWER